MNIHEYQAKAVLKEFGLPVSRGVPIFKPEEAEAAAKELGGPVWVVKSQIHAGGRGKGTFKGAPAGAKGGVRVTKSLDEVKQFAGEMLGQTLVTIQTGEAGKQVNRLYIEEGAQIEAEFYLSMLVDRETGRVATGQRPYVIAFAAGKGFVTDQYSNTVTVFDPASLKKVAAIDVGDHPEGIAASRDGSRLYVTNWGSNTLGVIDATTLKVIKDIPVPDGPRSFGDFLR